MSPPPEPQLSHVDEHGQARMVDVTPKQETARSAVAQGRVLLSRTTLLRVLQGDLPKGEVLPVARLAAIQAVKRTAELIPLCHPLRITGVEVTLVPFDHASRHAPQHAPRHAQSIEEAVTVPGAETEGEAGIDIRVQVHAYDRTGVEMEALHAVTVAALTLYDMCKAVDRGMRISEVRLVEKRGGRSGTYHAPA